MQPISLARKSPHMKVMSEPITLEGQEVADAKAMKAFREGDMSYYCYLIWFSQSVKPTTLEGHEIADAKAMKASKEGDMSYYCYSIWFAQSVPYSSMLFFLLMGEGMPGKPSDSSEILEKLGDRERTGIHLPQFPSLGLCIFFVNAYFSPELFVEWHLHGIKSFCFHALLSYNWQVQIVHVQGVHWLDTGTHCSDCYDQINGQSSTTHIYSCVCMPRWGHLRVTVFANSI